MTSDIDPELAEAVMPEDDDVPKPASRQKSTMGIAGIESVLNTAMDARDMDQETKGEF